MAGRIPRQFIDDLIARADIVDVVQARVPLKKAGREYKACCPFHEEKTPSFTVSPDKQFYHCFGCGAHGSALGFLMEYERMDFVEAVEELATGLGLEVPREADPGGGGASRPVAETDGIYEILGRAAEWYRQQLRRHPAAGRAVEYLKARGLTGEIAAEFGLGFAPPGWSNLREALGGDRDTDGLLERAGLLAHRDDGRPYDRLRDRIVFPILDRRGRTVGFGARALGDDGPKYLNSPETAVFHKGRELYGLHQARRAGARAERLIVVEGYMDVVALAQFGITNACATLGTAATAEQVESLFRASADVVFCFDGDAAGRRAAWKALETALPAMRDGRQAFFMFLPEGEDPDSLVRGEGPAAFEAALEEAASLGTFLFDHLGGEVDLATIDGCARLAEMARPLIARIPPGSFRRLAAGRLAEMTGLPGEDSTTLTPGGGPLGKAKPARIGGRSPRRTASPVRRALTLLVHHPTLASEVDAESLPPAAGVAGADLLEAVVDTLRESPNLGTAALVERFRDHEAGRHLGRLAAEEVPDLSDGLRGEFLDCLTRLGEMGPRRRFQELLAKARAGTLNPAERREFAALSTARDGGETPGE